MHRVHRMIPQQLLRYCKKRRIREIPVARATLDVVLLQNVLGSVARFSHQTRTGTLLMPEPTYRILKITSKVFETANAL